MQLMDFGSHNAATLGREAAILQRLSACQPPPAGAKRAGHKRSRAPMDDQLSRYRQSIANIYPALVFILSESSEAPSLGTECVSTFISRLSPFHSKTTKSF